MTIDVIIPTRNAPSVLAMTLAHYWANAHDPKLVSSVILLDNCSEDPGMRPVFADAMRRGAQVVRHERNIGVWASINRGLLVSRADKILVLTSDILLAPKALQQLHALQESSHCCPFLGPHVISDKQEDLWRLYEDSWTLFNGLVDTTTYNGACWLMTRECLEKVGYFDPRYYICYGDADYVQRLSDAGLSYGVTTGTRCLHLDKQSRQADHSASEDTSVEIQDWQRFAAKWVDRPEVLARHPQPDAIMYTMMKERYWNSQKQDNSLLIREVSA